MSHPSRRAQSAGATLALLLPLAAGVVRAANEDFSPTDERVRISLGATRVVTTTRLRADSTASTPGTTIDGENQFGLDRSNVEPKFQATVRVAERHRLSFDYFTLDRSANTTLTGAPVVFKDITLLPGDPLQTQLNLRTLGITYGYSFWHGPNLELAGTFGIHETDISAAARVQSPTRHLFQAVDEAGPVPTLGLDATWVASRKFYLDGRAQYLHVHVAGIVGSLGIYQLDALYRYRPNLAVGIGYARVEAYLSAPHSKTPGSFNFTTQGPEFFVRVSF